MDPNDYSSYYTGQSYAQYSSASSPSSSAAAYQQSNYHTSSGSEYGGQDYDAAGPADGNTQTSSTQRRGRGGTASTSGSTSTSARRREQNRLAQRALRQRRESHIRTLEDRILHTSLETRHLATENRDLSRQLQDLTLQNDVLRQGSIGVAGAGASAAPAHSTYPQGTYQNASQSMGYAGATAYNQSPLSSASTPSSTGDPSPSGATWPYDDPSARVQYDPSYWNNQQAYSQAYGQQYGHFEHDEDEEDEDEDEEQSVQVSHRHRRKR